MLGSEHDLQMLAKYFMSSPIKIWGAKTAYFVTVLISTKLCRMKK